MTTVAALLVGLAVWLAVSGRPHRAIGTPIAGAVGPRPGLGPGVATHRGGPIRGRDLRRPAALLAAVSVLLGVGGPAGVVAAAVVGLAVDRTLARLPGRAAAERTRQVLADLPLTLELLAAAVAAGSPPQLALAQVAAAVQGPLGHDLALVARTWSLGVPAQQAWAAVQTADTAPALLTTAAAFVRAERAGLALSGLLLSLAEEQRDEGRARAAVAARRAGVLAVLPLGLCFLPAFVVLGVVPLVVGLLGDVLG